MEKFSRRSFLNRLLLGFVFTPYALKSVAMKKPKQNKVIIKNGWFLFEEDI